MFVFVCAGCGAGLTTPLSQVALPVHAHQKYGNGIQLPVLMESGTFAVDPEPWGPPWRRWEEIDPDEAEARGIYAPVYALSDGAPGAIVIAPGDTRGTVLIPEKGGGSCCGLDGADGPNMACEACGLPVASRIDDCSLWQAVWLAPNAVRRLPVDGVDAAPLSWAELTAEGKGTPPFEPIATVGIAAGAEPLVVMEPAVGGGSRPGARPPAGGLGRPAGEGPGRPDRGSVPTRARRPAARGSAGAARRPGGTGTARPRRRTPTSSSCRSIRRRGRPGPRPTRLPRHTRCRCRSGCGCGWPSPSRTCPSPRRAACLTASSATTRSRRAPVTCSGLDRETFQHTLVRLSAVRSPWLRDIFENLTQFMYVGLF